MNRLAAIASVLSLALTIACGSDVAVAPPPTLDVASSHPTLLAATQTDTAVTVSIRAPQAPPRDAVPLNVSLVLDRSGSMKGKAWTDAIEALKTMLDGLGPKDRVSLVAFGSKADLILEQTEWSDVDREELDAKIAELTPRGTTAMTPALDVAIDQVADTATPELINRIILVSDGKPNIATELPNLASRARASDIAITTMGLGADYNEDLMTSLADTSGGRYVFVRDSSELASFFKAEKTRLDTVVARSVLATLHLGPNVRLKTLYGGAPDISGNVVRVYLGDMEASSLRQLGIVLDVTPGKAGTAIELLDVELTYTLPDADEEKDVWSYVSAESSDDKAVVDTKKRAKVTQELDRLHAAAELDGAVREFQAGGEPAEAAARIRQAAGKMRPARKSLGSGLVAPEPVVAPSAAAVSLNAYMNTTADKLVAADRSEDETKLLVKDAKQRNRMEQMQ